MEQVFGFLIALRLLDGKAVASLRAVNRSLSVNEALISFQAKKHPFFPALVAQEGGHKEIPSGEWRKTLSVLQSMREKFGQVKSMGSFSASIRILGDGPMSMIELHQHGDTGALVAIKMYSKESVVKFKKAHEVLIEKEALVDLQAHPLVIKLFGTFQSPDNLYFMLEFCPFGDLVDVIRTLPEKKFPLARCQSLLDQLVHVVRYLHGLKWIHRDIKCENILVGYDGRIRLSDFATAHRIGTVCEALFVGSPQYIPPEIIQGGVQPTEKVDYFAMGCVAYYIWTGTDAFLRGSDFLTWNAILKEPLDLSTVPLHPDDAWIRLFITGATEKDPEKRVMNWPRSCTW